MLYALVKEFGVLNAEMELSLKYEDNNSMNLMIEQNFEVILMID